jgi:hypothetical protein
MKEVMKCAIENMPADPCLFTYAELDAMDGSEVAFRYNAVDKVSE